MKNTKIIVITLIVMVTVLAMFFYWKKSNPGSLQINLAKKTSGEIIPKDLPETELQKKVADIITTKDFSQCERVQNETYKKVCINNIALNLAQETGDASYCQKLDNKLIPIESCQEEIILKKSVEKGDVGICAETEDINFATNCENNFYLQSALKNKDVNVCSGIKEENDFQNCYNAYFLITNNFSANPAGFNCLNLKGSDYQLDCEAIKKGGGCLKTKTNLFSSLCFQNK